jgi:hypothetical protein
MARKNDNSRRGTQDGHAKPTLNWALALGAGDENRTRTISLGICTIRAVARPDLRSEVSASDRERPLLTGVNGTPMARPPRRSWGTDDLGSRLGRLLTRLPSTTM